MITVGQLREYLETIEYEKEVFFVFVMPSDEKYLMMSHENGGIGVKLDNDPIKLKFTAAGKIETKDKEIVEAIILST